MAAEYQPEREMIRSEFLKREVTVDMYLPSQKEDLTNCDLLLVNDGQDLVTMDFANLLQKLYGKDVIEPLVCAGIHCGADRKNEYGTRGVLNEEGQGAKAGLYTCFVMEELLPFIRRKCKISFFKEKSFCGFSLGGLSALDIVWNHGREFSKVGAFSGSFWWPSVSRDDALFDESEHRIMHNEIKNGNYYPWLKFFFEAGTLDETADRNNNGIIDSIDDTLALILELEKKGYDRQKNIYYLELEEGKHDIATWRRAFPEFLKWGWRK